MAMYSAYFDESGHPDSGRYLIVAGCIADVEQWVHFEREWLLALAPLNTKVFHAVEFDERMPPFDKLSDQERADLLMRLINIICRRVEKTISGALDLHEHRAINLKYVFSECHGYPYPQVARVCIGIVENWAKKHSLPKDEIKLFFENGAKHKGQLQWIAKRDYLQIPVFLEKRHAPLQAGDLLAWCHHLALNRRAGTPEMYAQALARIEQASSSWQLLDLKDPDRLPFLLGIPLRDPQFTYKHSIVKKDGKRVPVIHYWPKANADEPKLDRKSLKLPERPHLTIEEFNNRAADYDGIRRSKQPEV
jgi:hypothetical protein